MNTQFIKELSSTANQWLYTLIFGGVVLYSAVNIGSISSYLADRFELSARAEGRRRRSHLRCSSHSRR